MPLRVGWLLRSYLPGRGRAEAPSKSVLYCTILVVDHRYSHNDLPTILCVLSCDLRNGISNFMSYVRLGLALETFEKLLPYSLLLRWREREEDLLRLFRPR